MKAIYHWIKSRSNTRNTYIRINNIPNIISHYL